MSRSLAADSTLVPTYRTPSSWKMHLGQAEWLGSRAGSLPDVHNLLFAPLLTSDLRPCYSLGLEPLSSLPGA